MNKIISIIINFLNRINKISWKIIIFLSKFIKVEVVNHVDKSSDEKYRLFKVDEQPIIEPFIKLEKKDYKQLIKENNIKPVKRRNGKDITIDIHCPCCGAPKEYLYDNTGKQNQFECKVVLIYSLLIQIKKKMLFLGAHIVDTNSFISPS